MYVYLLYFICISTCTSTWLSAGLCVVLTCDLVSHTHVQSATQTASPSPPRPPHSTAAATTITLKQEVGMGGGAGQKRAHPDSARTADMVATP